MLQVTLLQPPKSFAAAKASSTHRNSAFLERRRSNTQSMQRYCDIKFLCFRENFSRSWSTRVTGKTFQLYPSITGQKGKQQKIPSRRGPSGTPLILFQHYFLPKRHLTREKKEKKKKPWIVNEIITN